jgi:hypothetical protein
MQKRLGATECASALEDGRSYRAQKNGYMFFRSLKRPRTLIWLCLSIVTVFAYLRLGRQQHPFLPIPQEPPESPPLPSIGHLKDAEEIRAGLESGWKKPRQTSHHQSVHKGAAIWRQDVGLYMGRPSTSPNEDSSMRCESSDICDEAPGSTCHHGSDGLGCLKSPLQRREAVKSAIKWSWHAYKRCAWGKDELRPISCSDGSWIGLALTLVDGLDTLLLAGLDQVCNRMQYIWLVALHIQ